MLQTLQQELRQSKPFASLEIEAALSIARTAGLMDQVITEALRPHHLTPTQYNVLRILRGAGEKGLCRYEVGDRLVTPVPDVTRLLGRLEDAGLVTRTRDAEDRRHVMARVTPKGLALLDTLDAEVEALHARSLGTVGPERLRALIDLLAAVRAVLR